jgi:cysteinyl-tRNA synthetase
VCTSLAAAYIRRAKAPESNARSEARLLLLQDARALLDEAKALLPYMDLTSDQRELERIRLILLASECPSSSEESDHDAIDFRLGELDQAIELLRRFPNAAQNLEVQQLLANALEARASSRPSQSHQAKFDDLKAAEEIRSSFEYVIPNRQTVLAVASLRWELWNYEKKAKVPTHLKLLEKIADDKRLFALATEGDNNALKLLRDACSELARDNSQADPERLRARADEYRDRLKSLSQPADSGVEAANRSVVQQGKKRGFSRED